MGRINIRINELMVEREAREDRSISLAEVSREAGVAPDMLQALASNQVSHISLSNLARLCGYFQCTTSDLLAYEAEPIPLGEDEVESRDIVARWERTYGADEHPPEH